MIKNQEFTDYLKLHFIVLIWGFSTILGLLITTSALEIVLFRTLIATLALAAWLYSRQQSFNLGWRAIIKILATGFLIAAHWILFFWSARLSTASICLAGMATCSFWTSLIEPLMTKRKIKIYELLLGLFVIAGLYIILQFELNYIWGISMAVLSAILCSVFTVLNGNYAKIYPAYTITFYEMLGACLGTFIFIIFYDIQLLKYPVMLSDWLYLFILAGLCTVYAFAVSVEVQKTLSAFVVNLTVNLEPVYGIIFAFLIFGDEEQMSSGFYIGTSIILLSVLVYPLINRVMRRRALRSDLIR